MKSKNPNMKLGSGSETYVPRTSPRNRGFTLIELLIVVAMIGILIVMLFGGSRSLLDRAKATKCVANERQIIAAMLAYAAENEGRLHAYSDSYYSFEPLNPYLNVPAGKRIGVDYLECPAANRGYSYGIHYGPTAERMGVFGYENRSGFVGSLRLSQISSKTVIFGDSIRDIIYNPANWGLSNANDFIDPRHGGGFNCAFIDGSVRQVAKEEWYTNASPLWVPPSQ